MVDENLGVLRLSPLRHTWIFDLDGTLVEHNGYKHGGDVWLPGALEFLKSLPEDDFVLIMTAREEAARSKTEEFLLQHNVRFNSILFEMPMGERILFNDTKPSDLQCAFAVTPKRNQGLSQLKLEIDPNL